MQGSPFGERVRPGAEHLVDPVRVADQHCTLKADASEREVTLIERQARERHERIAEQVEKAAPGNASGSP